MSSNVKEMPASQREWNSSILVIEEWYLTFTAACFLSSMQNQSSPYFFGANTVMEDHSDHAGSITSVQIILSFVSFTILFFWSSAVCTRANRAYIRCSWFDAVFGHVNAAQRLVSHFLNFDKGYQNLLTIFGVLYISFEVVSTVCINRIIIDDLDFLASVQLVFSPNFFFVLHVSDSVYTYLSSSPLVGRMNGAWPKWTTIFSRSVLTPIIIFIGRAVWFREKDGQHVYLYQYGRPGNFNPRGRYIHPISHQIGVLSNVDGSGLLVVADTEASVLGGFAKQFTGLSSSVLSLLFYRSSVSVPVAGDFCSTASGSDSGVCFEIIATGQDWMGILPSSMGSIPLTNLSISNVRTRSGN